MIFSKTILLLAFSVRFFDIAAAQNKSKAATSSGNNAATTASSSSSAAAATGSNSNSNNNSGAITLNSKNVQTGSQSNGLADAEAGQAASLTDDANFINFCTGKTLTNGLQVQGGSCNGIVMGDIPSQDNMISTIITNPSPGDVIPADQDFNINLQVSNLIAGSFTNPDSTYYAAPQAIENGVVVGHTHVTVQSLGGNIATTTPPDPAVFVFFKGINDPGDGKGGLSAPILGGLPKGTYRVCTMTSSSNHQPVLMPVAQRGAQDDCTKFTVGGSTGNSNTSTGSGSSSTTSSAATAISTAANSGGGKSSSNKRFVMRNFIA